MRRCAIVQNCSGTLKPQVPPNSHLQGLFALCVCEAWSPESWLLLYDAWKYLLTGVPHRVPLRRKLACCGISVHSHSQPLDLATLYTVLER